MDILYRHIRKRNKHIQVGKEDVKLFAFVDNILYVENPMQSTKQYTKISEFSKVTEYKIHRGEKSNYFILAMNNQKMKFKNLIILI